VCALLIDRPRRRDLLIEHLHLIQDHYGHLSAAHIAALASEMKLALTEVYEVATFYAHFDVVKEGETPPPPVTVRVCDSFPVRWRAQNTAGGLAEQARANVRVVRAPCMGACDRAPVCAVGHAQVMHADVATVGRRRGEARACACLSYTADFDAYVKEGGYELLKACIGSKRSRDEIIKIVSDAGLRDLAARAFQPDGNGRWCGLSPRRACLPSIATKASRARSRTGTISSAIRIASSKAC